MSFATEGGYTYQSGTAMATRSLVSDDKPSTTTTSSSSADPQLTQKPTLQRRKTNHYEEAAAAHAAAGKSAAFPVDETGDRPGRLDRQQSWNYEDMKRQATEQVLRGAGAGSGYSTAQ